MIFRLSSKVPTTVCWSAPSPWSYYGKVLRTRKFGSVEEAERFMWAYKIGYRAMLGFASAYSAAASSGVLEGVTMKILEYQLAMPPTTTQMPQGRMVAQWCFHIPMNAEVLCVRKSGDMPIVYAMVGNAAPVPHYFTVYPTGSEVDKHAGKHVGTFEDRSGRLAWHVFHREGDPE